MSALQPDNTPTQPAQTTTTTTKENPLTEIEGAFLATTQLRMCQSGRFTGIIRALCDPSAQINIISAASAPRSGIKCDKSNAELQGIGQLSVRVTGSCVVDVCDTNIKKVIQAVRFLVVKGFTMTLPSQPLYKLFHGEIELADPGYCTPSKVQVILGAGICASLLNEVPPARQPDGSIALSSSLGWIVFGPIRATAAPLMVTTVTVSATAQPLDSLLQRFWECEDLNGPRRLSEDELWCEHHFRRSHYRDETGRYVVKLPLKSNASRLGSTREVARKRFLQLERRLSSDADMRAKYITFMRELVQLGHMSICDRPPVDGASVYHIPTTA